MLRPEVLNYILTHMYEQNIIYVQGYKQILKPKFPELTLEESKPYFSRLATDGYIRTGIGFGFDTEIELIDKGSSFVSAGHTYDNLSVDLNVNARITKRDPNKINTILTIIAIGLTVIGLIFAFFSL